VEYVEQRKNMSLRQAHALEKNHMSHNSFRSQKTRAARILNSLRHCEGVTIGLMGRATRILCGRANEFISMCNCVDYGVHIICAQTVTERV